MIKWVPAESYNLTMTTQIHDTHLDISALFDSSTTQAKDFVPQCMGPYTVIFGKARCLLSWLSGCMRLLTILLVLGIVMMPPWRLTITARCTMLMKSLKATQAAKAFTQSHLTTKSTDLLQS